jgi:ParB-like chromosome segregation protein Spo0J
LSVKEVVAAITSSLHLLDGLEEQDRIDALNEIRRALHERSPMRSEPIDCVIWERAEQVRANDYNPNSVAPPEMQLLQLSVQADGYTQPIVAFEEDGAMTVVDGFHRHRVGKEVEAIRARCKGRLPVTTIKNDRTDRADRIAATIRHNRARGKHGIEAMGKIVLELSRRNWSDEKIGTELGMQPDEVLRLKQVTGLADMFRNVEFSRAWDWVEPTEADGVQNTA